VETRELIERFKGHRLIQTTAFRYALLSVDERFVKLVPLVAFDGVAKVFLFGLVTCAKSHGLLDELEELLGRTEELNPFEAEIAWVRDRLQ
jgi:hypothetical protein